MRRRDLNPFPVSGPLSPEDMIDRDREAERLVALAEGAHASRLVGPRRYGKTTLLQRALGDAAEAGFATALVDLEGVLTMGSVVVRIERAYARSLKGPVRRTVDALFRSWNIGLSLGGAGFTARLQASPRMDVESVLLRLLDLPSQLSAKSGTRSFIVFDEIQDLLRVDGADGTLRSVIQHQAGYASYSFAGSAPSLMRKLFDDPSRPLLEHALPMELGPLPADETASYIEDRFRRTGRDPGDALAPLLAFARGHPQRTMLLAHQLWEVTPRGSVADESAWVEAQSLAVKQAAAALAARWNALPVNEQRLSMALATATGSVYEESVYRTVGLKRGSVEKALTGLEGRAEVMRGPHGPALADPFLEHWLSERGAL